MPTDSMHAINGNILHLYFVTVQNVQSNKKEIALLSSIADVKSSSGDNNY